MQIVKNEVDYFGDFVYCGLFLKRLPRDKRGVTAVHFTRYVEHVFEDLFVILHVCLNMMRHMDTRAACALGLYEVVVPHVMLCYLYSVLIYTFSYVVLL